MVEGAPIKRSRPLLHRRTVISNATLTIQFPSEHLSSEEVKIKHKPSGKKSCAVSTFCRSDKENQPVGEKKRQLTSVSPKRECEGRTEVQNYCVRRSCRNLVSEQLVIRNEPQSKARRLGLSLSGNEATLVPSSLSFSLSPPHSFSDCKTQNKPRHGSHTFRSFPPLAASQPQHRTSTQVFPSLHGPLPTLEVFSLRPKIVVGTIACRNPTLSSHSSFHRHQLFLRSCRQTVAKCKGDCTGTGHKY